MKRVSYNYGGGSPSDERPEKPAELIDLSPMPFGKHLGEPMEDVPAKYLFYLWNEDYWRIYKEDKHTVRHLVARYIARNFSALEKEDTDTIIEHRPEE